MRHGRRSGCARYSYKLCRLSRRARDDAQFVPGRRPVSFENHRKPVRVPTAAIVVLVVAFAAGGSAYAIVGASRRVALRPTGRQFALAFAPRGRLVQSALAIEQRAARSRRTPAERAVRLRSRDRFRNLARAQAVAVADRFFHLNRTAVRGIAGVRGATVQRDVARNAVVLALRSGKRVLLTSPSPLLVRDGRRRVVVSLALRHRGDSFVPAHPLESLSVSRDLSEGIDVGGLISVRPAVDAGVSSAVQVGNRVFFANTARDTDFSAQPSPLGVETFWELRAADSPENNALRFHLAPGLTMRPSRLLPGSIEIARGRAPVCHPPGNHP